jgi:NitT/TauT family transport system substrate-binding protein
MVCRLLRAAVFAAWAVLGACGGDDEDDLVPVVFQSKWFPQAQFAGYYVAGGHPPGEQPSARAPRRDGRTFYEAEGLDVTVLPGGTVNTSEQVAEGAADFATDWIANFLQKVEQNGLDLVHIAQIFQRSGFEMIALRSSNIASIEQFAGRTVGVWDFGNWIAAQACFQVHGLTSSLDGSVQDPDIVTRTVSFDPAGVFPGQVEVTSAMVYNELDQIIGLGYSLDQLSRFPAATSDCGLLEDFLFTSRELLETRNFKGGSLTGQEVAERFLRATLKGWSWAIDEANLGPARDVVLDFCSDTCNGSGSTQSPEVHQTWQLDQVRGLVQPAFLGEAEATIGCLDRAQYGQTLGLLRGLGLIEPSTGDTVVDDALLRAIGVDCPGN